MQRIDINLLKLNPDGSEARPVKESGKPAYPRAFFILLCIGFLLLAATSAVSYFQTRSHDTALARTFNTFFADKIQGLSIIGERRLTGEDEDRVNILLMGIGGKKHDGSHLTDSIMVVSIKPSTKQTAFISIPRDLLVEIEGYGWRKINNANAFGELVQEGQGPALASSVVSSTLGIPIHYSVRVDFDGFAQIIDILGGVTVTVDRPFIDYSYPAHNFKYQVVSFDAGEQTMDGDTALKFVRSRHSVMNNEGSDFARAARQQKVLMALKDKLLSAEFLLNPSKISEVLATLQQNILTNIEVWELMRLGRLAQKIDLSSAQRIVLDDGPTGLLTAEVIDGAYVLRPRDVSFDAIHTRARSLFNGTVENAVTVSLKNGTSVPGLAGKTAELLKEKGFTVSSIGNATNETYDSTVIYDFTKGEMKDVARSLAELFPTAQILPADNASDVSFLIILGKDQDTTQTATQ